MTTANQNGKSLTIIWSKQCFLVLTFLFSVFWLTVFSSAQEMDTPKVDQRPHNRRPVFVVTWDYPFEHVLANTFFAL